jgi:hypothetical protein
MPCQVHVEKKNIPTRITKAYTQIVMDYGRVAIPLHLATCNLSDRELGPVPWLGSSQE